MLLFGVPQKGMSVEALITMVNEQPNRDLIASLSVDSAFLQLQQSNFQKARLEMSNASVVAFFETQETPTVQKNVSLRYGLTDEPNFNNTDRHWGNGRCRVRRNFSFRRHRQPR